MRPVLISFAAAAVMMGALQTAHAADEKFVEEATLGGMTEVAAGEAAKAKGQSAEVKQFGAQMVTDHQKAGDELKSIVGKKNMKAPTGLDEKHQKVVSSLQAKSGPEFDKAFKKQMLEDHEKTVKLFEEESKSGKDPELKAFATKTLPTLKHHLEMAKAMK